MMQLIRYGLVGITSNLTIFFAYLFITHYGVAPKLAMTITYIAGATVGFFGNRTWTFAHCGRFLHSVVRYIIAHSLGYSLNFAILFTFVDQLGYSHQWVQASAIIIVAVFLFLLFKYFVFRKNLAI